MNLQEKVKSLVRYCGQHHSHGFMMDERNTDENFNITLPEEQTIIDNIDHLKVILLTGEAGDGKSRILKNIKNLLDKYRFSEPCLDFSALSEPDKIELIRHLTAVLDGESDERLIILANIGVFTQSIIKFNINLMQKLTQPREDVFLCNFENRNLAENAEKFQEIVNTFLKCETQCPHTACPCHADCVYRENIKILTSDSGLEAVRTICNAIYLTGGHVTFRELLSLLAYMITFGQSCDERQAYIRDGGNEEDKVYYNVFQKNDDLLLRKISNMDPALKRDDSCSDNFSSKEEYIQYRRKLFFTEKEKQYKMLNVDYLVEFHEVLSYMNQPPYHYDTVQDKNPILQMLKKGISKMNNKGKSDTGLVVTGTPSILGPKIQTEFLVTQDMSMIWHRYDIQIGSPVPSPEKMWNRFCLSYIPDTEESQLISLLIDYQQFRYLMMCSKDYFLNRNELTIEEYAVNTFYQKILQTKKQAYDSIVIRFEDKKETQCDFSLTVHSQKDIISGTLKQTVKIKKAD